MSPADSRMRSIEIRFGGIRAHKVKYGFQKLEVLFVNGEVSFSHISSVKLGGSFTKAAFRETKMCYCFFLYFCSTCQFCSDLHMISLNLILDKENKALIKLQTLS